MGGRGTTGGALAYQGKNGGSGRASSVGIASFQMKSKLDSLPVAVLNDSRAAEAVNQLKTISNGNDSIKIYRATIGDSINSGDWIFLSKAQAEKWTKTALGTKKPGVKVLQSKVKAKNVEWTGKNLEFVYTGKRSVK